MPVYNANGTLNEAGAIEGFVKVRMVLDNHAEVIELAVTNLGKKNIFLGLDWLRYHNPSIDWDKSTLTFDCCPDKCGYLPIFITPEDDSATQPLLEKGERLFMLDWEGYISNKGHI